MAGGVLSAYPAEDEQISFVPMKSNSTKTATEFLRATKWFRSLLPEAQRRVEADSFETVHARGEMAGRTGEQVHSWLGVVEGLVKIQRVQKDGKVVAYTGVPAGSWFGEGSVIRRDARRYDVVAMRDSRLLHVPSATFRWLLDISIEFNHFIIEHLNERLAQNMNLVETDRLIDPDARVARVIVGLFNSVLYPNMGPFVPISQEEFAELAGLSRQRTNAAVKNLEKADLVRGAYGGIFVDDINRLSSFVRERT